MVLLLCVDHANRSGKFAGFLDRHCPDVRYQRRTWRCGSARRSNERAIEGAPGGKSKNVAARGANRKSQARPAVEPVTTGIGANQADETGAWTAGAASSQIGR